MSKTTLTQKDINAAFWRINLFPMCTINYERFQSAQYCGALVPAIKKLYPDNPEERIKAAQRHMEFYNTTPEMINWTMGISLAQEEQIATLEDGPEREALENSVNAIKTSLMGPLAGIGDSMKATVNAILGAIAAGFALNGSILGPILYFVGFNTYHYVLSRFAFKYSYENGTKAITDLQQSGMLERIMEAATILGLTSLGSLIPSWIGFSLDKDFIINDLVINIQTELNNIFPGLVPLALTLVMAYFYSKRVSALKLVGLIFVMALVMSLVGF